MGEEKPKWQRDERGPHDSEADLASLHEARRAARSWRDGDAGAGPAEDADATAADAANRSRDAVPPQRAASADGDVERAERGAAPSPGGGQASGGDGRGPSASGSDTRGGAAAPGRPPGGDRPTAELPRIADDAPVAGEGGGAAAPARGASERAADDRGTGDQGAGPGGADRPAAPGHQGAPAPGAQEGAGPRPAAGDRPGSGERAATPASGPGSPAADRGAPGTSASDSSPASGHSAPGDREAPAPERGPNDRAGQGGYGYPGDRDGTPSAPAPDRAGQGGYGYPGDRAGAPSAPERGDGPNDRPGRDGYGYPGGREGAAPAPGNPYAAPAQGGIPGPRGPQHAPPAGQGRPGPHGAGSQGAAPHASGPHAAGPQAGGPQGPGLQAGGPQGPGPHGQGPQGAGGTTSQPGPYGPGHPQGGGPTPAQAWHRYDPWSAPQAPLYDAPPRRRRGRSIVSGVIIAVLAGGIGGGVGAYVERNGGVGDVSLDQAPQDDEAVKRDPKSVAGIAAKALPGVVTIHTRGSSEQGTGTGFVLNNNGHILTNNHVVEPGASDGEITVTFSGGESRKATIVGRDSGYDLAVIKVSGVTGLKPLKLGNSDSVAVGDPVVAIGAPYDLANTVTSGIISAKERPITAGGEKGDGSDISYVNALQTDAPINPGNSGGPLMDGKGRVIGINSAIRGADNGTEGEGGGQGGSIGLGFAIPVNQGKRVAEELINTGKATHPVIGVTLDMKYTGDGAKVGQESGGKSPVTENGPADDAGIEPGDVITKVDGDRVHNGEELIVKVRSHRPGDKLKLTVERDGSERSIEVTLGSAGG